MAVDEMKTISLIETTESLVKKVNNNFTYVTENYQTTTAADGKYVEYDTDAQGLTSTEKANARTNIGAGTYSKPSGGIPGTDLADSYQPLDADLTAIAGLSGTSGLLKKTAADTWALDTTTYATENYVDTAIANLPEPMVFKGTLGAAADNPTITELPAAAAANEGFTYKVITAGTYASQAAKVGDVFVSNGSAWVLIPAGDDIDDTWRSIKVNGTELLGSGTTTGAVNFKNGSNVTITGSGNDITIAATDTNDNQAIKARNAADTADVTFGANDVVEIKAGTNVTSVVGDASAKTITINVQDTTYSPATSSADGLMSSTDKSKLDGIAAGATKVAASSNNGKISVTQVVGGAETTSDLTVYTLPFEALTFDASTNWSATATDGIYTLTLTSAKYPLAVQKQDTDSSSPTYQYWFTILATPASNGTNVIVRSSEKFAGRVLVI